MCLNSRDFKAKHNNLNFEINYTMSEDGERERRLERDEA